MTFLDFPFSIFFGPGRGIVECTSAEHVSAGIEEVGIEEVGLEEVGVEEVGCR